MENHPGCVSFGCCAKFFLIKANYSSVPKFKLELSRAALEAIALEAYRERKLTAAQLRRILGFETRYQLDGFLKKHEVWLEYTWQDLERDRKTHRQLGL